MQSKDLYEVEQNSLKLFRKNLVSGVFASISIETDNVEPFHKMEDMGIPVVFFDRVPEEPGYTKVCLSDETAARIAAEAIIKKKKRTCSPCSVILI